MSELGDAAPGRRWFELRINPPVFFGSAIAILSFVAVAALFPSVIADGAGELQGFIIRKVGWLYLVSVTGFLGFLGWLALSRHGAVRLGRDDEKPSYGFATWFSMLFSAGMGIGLLFYSVAEPILHFQHPGVGEPGSREAARWAMETTFFHWGLHAWAIYALMGLGLAYAHYRHGAPLTLRSALRPLLGARVDGWVGHWVDSFAIVGTLFGVATSLGLGVMQINEGLFRLTGFEQSVHHQLWLIAGITLIATASVVSGLDRGIKFLSEFNMVVGLLLLAFVLLAGPTTFLVLGFVGNLGDYLQHLVGRSLDTLAYRGDAGLAWQGTWTMFYWGWWIAWSPFVGMFVARVSRGRTIREFVFGVLIVPTLFGGLWISVFGNTALGAELFGSGGIVSAVERSVPSALYATLETLPLAGMSSALATLVIVTYFVTSSDSGSLVIDILSADGHPNPPVVQRIFWALTEGAVAAVLLVAGGQSSLTAMQTAAITTALPLTLLLIMVCLSLRRALLAESSEPVPLAASGAGPLAASGAGPLAASGAGPGRSGER